jgi:hypothetical protein
MASMTRLAKECRKSSRQLLRRLCLSEIKLAHTDDEVRQEMATVGAAGICHFLPSAQARPGGDGASQVSLIRLISDCLSGQESSHHILNFFAKYIAHGEFLVSSCLRPWRIRRVWIGISQPFAR